MKTVRITLSALLIALTSVLAISPANAGELDVLGAKLSWSDRMYVSDGCSRYEFSYFNGTGVELLSLGFELNDPFGRSLTWWSETGIKPNKSGTWNQQICRSSFTNGTGPYIIKLTIKDYASTQRQSTKDIYFLPLPTATPAPTAILQPAPTVTVTATPAPAPRVTVTATPAPAPTVTVTATPAPAPTVTVTATPAPAPTVYVTNPSDANLTDLVTSLKSQVTLLNAKLKKICAVKPKPKGC